MDIRTTKWTHAEHSHWTAEVTEHRVATGRGTFQWRPVCVTFGLFVPIEEQEKMERLLHRPAPVEIDPSAEEGLPWEPPIV